MAFAVPILSEGFTFDIIAFQTTLKFDHSLPRRNQRCLNLKSLFCCPFTNYLKFKSAHRNSSATLIQRNINKNQRKRLIISSFFCLLCHQPEEPSINDVSSEGQMSLKGNLLNNVIQRKQETRIDSRYHLLDRNFKKICIGYDVIFISSLFYFVCIGSFFFYGFLAKLHVYLDVLLKFALP